MDEIGPPRLSRVSQVTPGTPSDQVGTSSPAGPSTTTTARRSRYAVVEDDGGGGGGERIECSGKYCQSCSATVIADCVALCCCPCALVNLLTLAFVKVPWKVGRKLVRFIGRKSQGQNRKIKRKCKADDHHQHHHRQSCHQWVVEIEEGERMAEISSSSSCYGFAEEEQIMAMECVWLELHQIGHLGFGRVSFREIREGQLGNKI